MGFRLHISLYVILWVLVANVLVLGQSLAQESDSILVRPGQLDSLEQLIQKGNQDTNQIILLNEYARLCFYDLEYVKGFKAMMEARDKSKRLKFERGDALYYTTLSALHRNNDLELYYTVLADMIVSESVVDLYRNDQLFPLGSKDSDHSAHIRSLEECLNDPELTQIREIKAQLHYSLFYQYRELGDSLKAVEHFNTALHDYSDIDYYLPKFGIVLTRMYDLAQNGNDRELQLLELDATEIIDRIEDITLRGILLSQLARHYFFSKGQVQIALEYYLRSASLLEELGNETYYWQVIHMVGVGYALLGDNQKAVTYMQKELEMFQRLSESQEVTMTRGAEIVVSYDYINLVGPLIRLNRLEEAKEYLKISRERGAKFNNYEILGRYYLELANIKTIEGKIDTAIVLQSEAIRIFDQLDDWFINWKSTAVLAVAASYRMKGDYGRALEYALKGHELALSSRFDEDAIESSRLVAEIYQESGQYLKSQEYLELHLRFRDLQDLATNRQMVTAAENRSLLQSREREIYRLESNRLLTEEQARTQRLWIFSISGGLFSAIILAIVLYRNAQNRKKANAELKRQKEEVQSTLHRLQDTQQQLIHSEKMASLGEMTAGIAHEIQNPLNFVNNFSDVNKELAEELKEAVEKGNKQEAEAIIADMMENEQKIHHHGQRADAIVKSMLQHSRGSSGEKEPTDINVLCDEYLRLAYHGLRAKDKSFNAEFKLELDESLPKVKVVPQDIGRVILNLVNNAFHAVSNAKGLKLKAKGDSFKPLVTISSRILDDQVEISVKDNGPGIPEQVRNRIFEPFFTTKETGQGTGLGLSLSYDIVTKGHGGQINVASTEGEGTVFTVLIPLS